MKKQIKHKQSKPASRRSAARYDKGEEKRPPKESMKAAAPISLPNEAIAPSPDLIYGRNAVREALKNGRSINKVIVAENAHGGSLQEIISLARKNHVVVNTLNRKKLDLLTGTQHHQGIAAYTAPIDYADLDDVLIKAERLGRAPFLIMLDEIEDPQNLGAIIRTADAAGADAVLIPKRRSCPLSSTVSMISAGAVEYMPVVRVNSLLMTLEKLKKNGFWVTGAESSGTMPYYEADLKGPLVLVIGSEGKGISQQVQKACDFLVRIPMCGRVNSLNASNAAAILMYEALKQRSGK